MLKTNQDSEKNDINKWYKWIFIALIGKLTISALLWFNLGLQEEGGLESLATGGDSSGYILAAKNILEKGIYNISQDARPYTGRMPGYEPVIILSSLFKTGNPFDVRIIILFQIILSAISVYCLSSIAYQVFKNKYIFHTVFITYLLSTFTSYYDITILCESITVSITIIATYLFLFKREKKSNLLIVGLLLTWGIFLRQYIVPLFVFFILYLTVKEFKNSSKIFSKNLFQQIALLIIPFLVVDSLWLLRNFNLKNKIIPFVDSYHGLDPELEARDTRICACEFVKVWGGDLVWWNSIAEIRAFYATNPKIALSEKQEILEKFPTYIYTSKYNKDSLKWIQLQLDSIEHGKLDSSLIVDRESLIREKFNSYKQSFIEERKLIYYAVAPIVLAKKFLIHSGTYNISKDEWAKQNIGQKAFKLFYTLLYLLVVFGGFIGGLIVIGEFKKSYFDNIDKILIVIIAFYMPLLLCFILRRIEYRYFVLSYPFFLVLMNYAFFKAYSFFKSIKEQKQALSNV